MRLSERYAVPQEIALLYEFANSIDLRRFVQQGTVHVSNDELGTAQQLEDWMRARGLLEPGDTVDAQHHRRALALREALRSFLAVGTEDRLGDVSAATRLNEASARFPLVVSAPGAGNLALRPASGSSGLGRVLAELQLLSETNRLDRLKICASDECRWVFYDRSKPGNRRWCSSALCGNRQKTRAYRRRHRESAPE
jgi:predicted RNA-binding Zn ribbon-like protein